MSQTFIQTAVIGAFVLLGNTAPGIIKDAYSGEGRFGAIDTPLRGYLHLRDCAVSDTGIKGADNSHKYGVFEDVETEYDNMALEIYLAQLQKQSTPRNHVMPQKIKPIPVENTEDDAF